jgi:hypothetical protein
MLYSPSSHRRVLSVQSPRRLCVVSSSSRWTLLIANRTIEDTPETIRRRLAYRRVHHHEQPPPAELAGTTMSTTLMCSPSLTPQPDAIDCKRHPLQRFSSAPCAYFPMDSLLHPLSGAVSTYPTFASTVWCSQTTSSASSTSPMASHLQPPLLGPHRCG